MEYVNEIIENLINLLPCCTPFLYQILGKKVGIDLIQLPKSPNGNQYCITLTDYFSKWPEAEAVPTKEASHVAAFHLKKIFRHGSLEEIVSDQGTECCNQLIYLLEKHTSFKHKVTSAYHP